MTINPKLNRLNTLAENLLKKGGHDEAIEAIKHSIRLAKEEDMPIYLTFIESLLKKSEYKYSKVFLNTMIKSSKNLEAYFLLASIYKNENDSENALKCYYEAFLVCKDTKKDINVYRDLLNIFIEINDIEKILEVAYEIYNINNKDKDILSLLANGHRTIKKYKEAIFFFNELINNNMADHTDYQYYAVCLHELKEYQNAEKMYLLALDLYPVTDGKLKELKNIRNKSLSENYSNIEESIKEYKAKIEESSDCDYTSYFHLGNLEYIKKNYKKALEYYGKSKNVYLSTR